MALQQDYRSALAERVDERHRDGGRDFVDAVWAARIRNALDEQRLELVPQQIVPLTGGAARVALSLQMIDGDGDGVAAEAFLPAAGKFGLVAQLDRWVVAKAVRFAALGRIVHVRLSGASLRDTCLSDGIADELRATGAPPANLIFELPADALVSEADGGEAFAAALDGLGCGLALCNITADMALALPARLPVRALTIERDVVRGLLHGPRDRDRARTIVRIARAMDAETIAHGVDGWDALALLRRWGVDYAQREHTAAREQASMAA
jgi:EAL domain-containing protein (putative c-di-GMP-specific phosphodiesterase class I)